ncbi:6885_t:CDS:2 [Diversispora eburnea]|uniref:6885_t:CDS:1 n=1 Tax=Diversispora eburnea TaxID=1213867 RepID=A0A9N8V5X3_9GLOM|nr:6885_t:CDS:2 [Diversispora eburnea]
MFSTIKTQLALKKYQAEMSTSSTYEELWEKSILHGLIGLGLLLIVYVALEPQIESDYS